MMKCEFEKLAKYEVSDEVYKAIENLYMNSNLDKVEFVKKYGLIFRNFRKREEEKIYAIKQSTTPNGCYYIVRYAKLIKFDVGLRKTIIRYISEEERIKNNLDIYSYHFDFDKSECIEG